MQNNVIAFPKTSDNIDLTSKSVLETYKKMLKGIKKENGVLYCHDFDLTDEKNIINGYTSATIYAALGILSPEQKIVAKDEIVSLIGNYNFSLDFFRVCAKVYQDLILFKSMNVSKDNAIESNESLITGRLA